MNSRFTFEQLEEVRHLDASTLANAIESCGGRLRNEGFTDASVHCLLPELPPMLGYAATLTIRGSSPPTAGSIYGERTDWWDYLASLPEPRVIVIEDASDTPGLGAIVGAVKLSILKALHCVSVVTNGSVRDIAFAEQEGMRLFAANTALSQAYLHVIEFGKPVSVGGLKIESGNLLHGDRHGVQCVPPELVPRIPAIAERMTAREKALIDLCHSPECSVEGLREAVRERLIKDCRNRLLMS